MWSWREQLSRNKTTYLRVGLLVLFLLPAMAPFFRPGYFWNANDARHDVYFIFEYHRAVEDGILFPRWSPDFTFGYGYPFFNVYAPLAVQVGEVLHLMGWSFTAAVKGVFILSILLSAMAMFTFAREWLSPWAAWLAALVYTYAPYHLFDMYQRAAMAESFSFVWLPWVLQGVRRSMRDERPGGIWLLALAYGGLMLTSNLVAVLFTPVVILYTLFSLGHLWWTRKEWTWGWVTRPLVGGLLGLGLSAWFWLPALAEFRYVNQEQWYGGYYDFHQHFVYFFQLFSPHWGFGISVPGPDDVISYQLGLVPYLLALAGLWHTLHTRDGEIRRHGLLFLLTLVGAIFLTTGASAWLWDHIPGIAFAQFPWRYLLLAVLSLSLLVGIGYTRVRSVWIWVAAILLLWGSAPYLRVQVSEPLPEQGPVGLPALMRFQASAHEMTGVTVYATRVPTWSGLAEQMVRGTDVRTRVDFGHVERDPGLEVRVLGYTSREDRVWYRAEGEGHAIVFNRQMYPGWKAYIYDAQGQRVEQVLSWEDMGTEPPYGLVRVPVPAGEHILVLRFEDTWPRRVGKALSWITAIGLFSWFIHSKSRRRATAGGSSEHHATQNHASRGR